MSAKYDAIVVGAGHNGLTAAAVPGARGPQGSRSRKASRGRWRGRHRGGVPGFKFSVCSYVVSLLRPEIIRELGLARTASRSCRSTARSHRWRAATTSGASMITRRPRREIARHSRLDADVYDEYGRAMARDGPIRESDPRDDAARSRFSMGSRICARSRSQSASAIYRTPIATTSSSC